MTRLRNGLIGLGLAFALLGAPANPILVPSMAFWSSALVSAALLAAGFQAAALAAR